MLEQILKYPGFIYEIKGKYYFLGKWICKECLDTEATDSAFMYRMNRTQKDEPETPMYFHRIRAFSDFALEVPYNPALIKKNLSDLLSDLSDTETQALKKQLHDFAEDYSRYCGEELPTVPNLL